MSTNDNHENGYVGTLVGESTSQEFRLAVHAGAVREQDIIAVDADLERRDSHEVEAVRVWAKVQRIERLNPLFPSEAGHELAQTRTNPLDTILSFSREMVTAVCQVLGYEPRDASGKGRLDHLRYPAQPASSAYMPSTEDISRIVLGKMKKNRGLDLAALSNRPDVAVEVDGHVVVTRHLAILAMTGAGKSWTARRLIEQLAAKRYPVVVFDSHGDYTGLGDGGVSGTVKLYRAHLPILDEESGEAAQIINGLSGEEITPAQLDAFDAFFPSVKTAFDGMDSDQLALALKEITGNSALDKYPLNPDLLGMSHVADALAVICKESDAHSRDGLLTSIGFELGYPLSSRLSGTYSALARKVRRAGFAVRRMEAINRARAAKAEPLPLDRTALVKYDQISVVSLAGYAEELQATIFTLIADALFTGRVQGRVATPFVLVLEEAHNFVPARAEHPSIQRSIGITKQIAQEGRKFGVGLVLISQRPSRLDETALSQCNSQIIMRMVNPNDQNFVRRVVESLGDDEVRMLPALDVGEAILAGQMINFPVLARIKPPESKGEHEEEDAFKVLEEAHQKHRAGESG